MRVCTSGCRRTQPIRTYSCVGPNIAPQLPLKPIIAAAAFAHPDGFSGDVSRETPQALASRGVKKVTGPEALL